MSWPGVEPGPYGVEVESSIHSTILSSDFPSWKLLINQTKKFFKVSLVEFYYICVIRKKNKVDTTIRRKKIGTIHEVEVYL